MSQLATVPLSTRHSIGLEDMKDYSYGYSSEKKGLET
jgi:hypothetical protein